MTERLINFKALQLFSRDKFQTARPFPWHNFQGFLTAEGFQQLYREFPPLEFFEKHEGLERGYEQRPHNRYYLAYEKSSYHPPGYRGKGVIQRADLPKCWQKFIKELEGTDYQEFVKSAFGVPGFTARYAWHMSFSSSEVSPHQDVLEKIGLHLFYFNTSEDWDVEWGGSTLVLGGLQRKFKNPDFSDFATVIPMPFLDNHSFFFRNTPNAWHGVKPLQCPEGKYRRMFSVIFEAPDTWLKKYLRQAKRLVLKRKVYAGEKR